MKRKRYALDRCALYMCSSRKRLEHILNLELGTLKQIDEMITYHRFQINKKDSEEKRNITAPQHDLKRIQKRILYLLRFVQRPEWLISGEKGKSYVDNGKVHQHSNYMLTVDVRSFYDNCKREAVYRFFRYTLKTAPDIAAILTDIVTFDGGIPTGCPTSQLIAYYAYEDMFVSIAETAERYGCLFSLYVDDMTFSSTFSFDPKKLAREVDIILRKYGHKPKYPKVHYYSKGEIKSVTGTAITPDHRLVAPNKLTSNIYFGFMATKENSEKGQLPDAQQKEIRTLVGRVQAARSIEPDCFPEITRRISYMNDQITR